MRKRERSEISCVRWQENANAARVKATNYTLEYFFGTSLSLLLGCDCYEREG